MSINKRFGVQMLDDYREFGAKGSVAITRGAKAGFKAAVAQNKFHVQTGSLQANWKLKRNKDSYVPKRYGDRSNPRPPARVPAFTFRMTKDKGFNIYNNMEYAENVEYGHGPGGRSPMLAIPAARVAFSEVTIAEFRRIEVGK